MSKATKLRRKAQNKTLNNLIKEKLTSKPQPVKSIEPTTLTNGQKGLTITFDSYN